ncbi:MAG: hypothetical protein MUE95_04435 [Cyclobacteriaceae bacterium]|nr:hypothetical protein [Cyclobacteriaceae bacterium]
MKASSIFILALLPFIAQAQIDYNYNQVDRVTSQSPIKIIWIKKSQIKQSVSFDHLFFFVDESGNDDITGHKVVLDVYHNYKIVHTKEFTTMSKAPNSLYMLSPLKLKPNDSVYFNLNLKPNKDSIKSSYLISIKNRTIFLRKNPEQYREMLNHESESVTNTTSPNTKPKSQSRKAKGMFGETYDPDRARKKKKSSNGWIDVLGFLFGM